MEENKTFGVVQRTNMFAVYLYNGGALPDVLKGMYTSESLANKAIEDYLRIRDYKPEPTRPVFIPKPIQYQRQSKRNKQSNGSSKNSSAV